MDELEELMENNPEPRKPGMTGRDFLLSLAIVCVFLAVLCALMGWIIVRLFG
jgi:hypothetical protein